MKKKYIFIIFVIRLQIVYAQKENNTTGNLLPIAYVSIDSLLLNSQFVKDMNESLIKKQEEYRMTINNRARKLQTEMDEFQKKLDKEVFQSRKLAEQEQSRLQKEQKELEDLDNTFNQQLVQEQQKISEAFRSKIKLYLLEYNKDRKYEIIFSNTSGDNILFAASGYDITSQILKELNEAYNKNLKNEIK